MIYFTGVWTIKLVAPTTKKAALHRAQPSKEKWDNKSYTSSCEEVRFKASAVAVSLDTGNGRFRCQDTKRSSVEV